MYWVFESMFCFQIRALQILETVNLMAGGYPHRMRFKNFNARYRALATIRRHLARSDELALDDCKSILDQLKSSLQQAAEENNNNRQDGGAGNGSICMDWALGKKHIFLSEGAHQHLELLRTRKRELSARRVQAMWRGHHARRKWPALRTALMRTQHQHQQQQQQQIMSRHVSPQRSSAGGNKLVGPGGGGGPGRPRPQPISGTPPPDALQNGLFLNNKSRHNQQQQPYHLPQQLSHPGMAEAASLPMGSSHGGHASADRCDFKTIQKTCSLFGLDLVS